MAKIQKQTTEEIINAVMTADEESLIEEPQKPKASSKVAKRIGLALFVLLNAVVIFFIAKDALANEPPPMEPFSFANILFLLGGIMCLVVVLGCETTKYLLMMKHLGEKVSVRHAFSTAALGKYYDCITPSGAGGQPFQIWYLHSQGYSVGASSAMPLSGFFTMQFGFSGLCLIMFTFFNGAMKDPAIKITAYIGAVAYMVVPIMIIISGFAPKIAMRIVAFFVRIGAFLHIVKNPNHAIMKSVKTLNSYSRDIKKITANKRLLVKLLLLSLLFQTAMCSMPFFAIHTFGGTIDYFTALALCTFIQAAISLIPTPGNSGAAEGAFYIIFSTFWPTMLWRFLCYYSFIIIGVLIYAYTAFVKFKERKKAKQIEDQSK